MARLPQFRDSLTASQIAEGMTLALSNAARLAADAQALLDQGRLPSAVALAILSIEESGKVSVLRRMVVAGNEAEYRSLWKAYRSHTKKNVLWPFGELVKQGARTLDNFKGLFDAESDHPDMLDQLKQLCFYTDRHNEKWSTPDKVEIDGLVQYLVQMAKILGRPKVVRPEELDLWRKHLLPVKNAPLSVQKAAAASWYHEMKLRGYADIVD